jgi:hypothetical protein
MARRAARILGDRDAWLTRCCQFDMNRFSSCCVHAKSSVRAVECCVQQHQLTLMNQPAGHEFPGRGLHLSALAPNVQHGEQIFMQRCSVC